MKILQYTDTMPSELLTKMEACSIYLQGFKNATFEMSVIVRLTI